MTKFRPVRGMLHDAMNEVVEVDTFDALVKHLRDVEYGRLLARFPKEDQPTKENVKVEPYTYDSRIGWDTYLVTVNGKAAGYTDGPLT